MLITMEGKGVLLKPETGEEAEAAAVMAEVDSLV